PAGSLGPAGAAGTAGLHALTAPACEIRCELTCAQGEKVVSVTCPGGKIHIGNDAESATATCVGGSGPALALCMSQ
ncbi:MAG: hypothetical protein WBW06_10750, partial [Xanthobacteraceae bacterium]